MKKLLLIFLLIASSVSAQFTYRINIPPATNSNAMIVCSGSASSSGCTDMNVAYSASTEYYIDVYTTDNGTTCYGCVNGTCVSRTGATIPTATTAMGPGIRVETLTSAQRLVNMAQMSLEQN